MTDIYEDEDIENEDSIPEDTSYVDDNDMAYDKWAEEQL